MVRVLAAQWCKAQILQLGSSDFSAYASLRDLVKVLKRIQWWGEGLSVGCPCCCSGTTLAAAAGTWWQQGRGGSR